MQSKNLLRSMQSSNHTEYIRFRYHWYWGRSICPMARQGNSGGQYWFARSSPFVVYRRSLSSSWTCYYQVILQKVLHKMILAFEGQMSTHDVDRTEYFRCIASDLRYIKLEATKGNYNPSYVPVSFIPFCMYRAMQTKTRFEAGFHPYYQCSLQFPTDPTSTSWISLLEQCTN